MLPLFSQISGLLKWSWETNLGIYSHFFRKFLGHWNQVGLTTWDYGHTFFSNFLGVEIKLASQLENTVPLFWQFFLFVKSKLGNQLERISNAIAYSKSSKKKENIIITVYTCRYFFQYIRKKFQLEFILAWVTAFVEYFPECVEYFR